MDWVYETEHLAVDYLERVFVTRLRPQRGLALPELLGYIDRDPAWPAERLGAEPKWYLTELNSLIDLFDDGAAFRRGIAAEGEAAYRAAQGF